MSVSRGAKNVPPVVFEYFSTFEFMEKFPFMYGMDKMREGVHMRLCKHYGVTKEQTLPFTDNLNKYDPVSLHDALCKLKK